MLLGLIVNPVAGLGGRVGLKGSDGAAIQQRARELGAVSESLDRTVTALKRLNPHKNRIKIVTYPGEMGENAARMCGFDPIVIGTIQPGATSSKDTFDAALEMHRLNVKLILFAGGDGTARDIYMAVREKIPVLGIPAGVKIQSAVFAINPGSAGELAGMYMQDQITTLREAEVMDIVEEAYRQGALSPQLYGYMRIPFTNGLVQARKSPSRPDTQGVLDGIALAVIDQMDDDWMYLVGPGTTTRAILSRLGLPKTLIGVDVVWKRQLLAADVNEAQILEFLIHHPAKIIVTPIGGQGFLFGRGNQQFSPAVIRKIGKENIIVVSSLDKIESLYGRPFLIDTGNQEIDQWICGYVKVITGYNDRIVYQVSTLP